ncbi:FAD-dependent oxidoreductase [Propionibacterium australiense]|uniref:CoA-disulfide reductase n=1 Tax=Propionibacterium australiense TaxID=119981 RepID=A0A383S607_9ACTN|nr:FAD-dependent oxidoreductase [Propionibacterium australiense]RLP08998.1 CoA-disulfide reductase [Propionibacterium australiense]RLP09068.1 CoA-disulfide reductase [Propionibacterium australiense]SYZ33435.1 FAD-dependent pyridine nucleotide reductase signature [Propionibacterium australiense]VEH91851.1 Coenzyme A disulfide reductase [Propionibacterium australiense]
MRIIIVGGVAGGMSAATRLRRLDETAQITVIERSGHVSFANCGLPYYLGGVIEERSELLLQTPQSLASRFGIDVRVRHEAIGVDPAARSLTVRELDTGETCELLYDALLLSPGARPVRPPIPGIERALSLRTVEDVDAIAAAAERASTAVVIGGGFIGVELVENLARRGLAVTLVEGADQVLAPLDPEMAELVHDRLRASGVRVLLGRTAAAIESSQVVLDDGSAEQADLVVAAIGVRPDSQLAAEAGCALGSQGGILVDEHFATSVPGIWAVGDAVQKTDAIDGSGAMVALAQTANLQGRSVADAIVGRPAADRPVRGSFIVGVLGLQVAATGWNERRARAAGRALRIIHTHPGDHAGYYPGAEQMHLKLVVDADTDAILGAQGVGASGVDKRIDVIATAMAGGLRAAELGRLELAYAPQFSSAKDPVNMLGFIDENLRDGLAENLQWHELDAAVAAGATVLDVRSPAEHAQAAIPGSLLIPLDELRDRLDELPDGDIVVYCAVGLRGYLACRILAQHGRRARNLDGGLATWVPGSAVMRPSGQ